MTNRRLYWKIRVDRMLACSQEPNLVTTAFTLGQEYADATAIEDILAISAQLERLENLYGDLDRKAVLHV